MSIRAIFVYMYNVLFPFFCFCEFLSGLTAGIMDFRTTFVGLLSSYPAHKGPHTYSLGGLCDSTCDLASLMPLVPEALSAVMGRCLLWWVVPAGRHFHREVPLWFGSVGGTLRSHHPGSRVATLVHS